METIFQAGHYPYMETIHLGQHICKTKISGGFVSKLNNLIDDELERKAEVDASKSLSGKIKKEYSVAHILKQADQRQEITNIMQMAFDSYKHDMAFKWHLGFNSAWGNDQREHEYQIVHRHSGYSSLGFSTIIYLKVPDFGPEFTTTAQPTNGRAVMLGNGGGQLSITYRQIEPQVGDMYIFPYDMEHIVYPFFGDGMRRSISANFDLIGSKEKK